VTFFKIPQKRPDEFIFVIRRIAPTLAATGRGMNSFLEERVLDICHWTERLFSFKTTRDPSFRFRNGQFTMLGVQVDGRPLLRAYSVVSPNYDESLEFFSIKVPNGPLTSRLQHVKVGDPIIISRKATGTLVLDNLLPGRNLYLLGTGTGLAPFMSLIRDFETYERFEHVILVHGCRNVADLAYSGFIETVLPNDEFIGADVRMKLIYYPTVTREAFRNRGRITDLIATHRLPTDIGLEPIASERDRVMLCGSPQMVEDMRDLLGARGFLEGSHGGPGHFVVEKAFVER
jgi:ferredoxin/flavodoxin---NADP+ reductase